MKRKITQRERRAPRIGGLLMDGEGAARELGISRRSLERWRLEGTGPVWVKVGRLCMYRREDLAAFVARHRIATSEGA